MRSLQFDDLMSSYTQAPAVYSRTPALSFHDPEPLSCIPPNRSVIWPVKLHCWSVEKLIRHILMLIALGGLPPAVSRIQSPDRSVALIVVDCALLSRQL